jgi:shikimate dehydrogenase
MRLSGAARIAGVIGWPVAHSLSPMLHGFWLCEHRIDGAYIPLPVRAHVFSTALRGLREAGFAGVNVTVPHKEAAFALAHRGDGAAGSAGAANLLLFQGNEIEARNTDAEGLAGNLVVELGTEGLREAHVTILGAGGAARAAVLACGHLHAARIHLLNRTVARAQAAAAALARGVRSQLDSGSWDEWPSLAPTTTLLINATRGGMSGSPSPDLPLDLLPTNAVVCDLVYRPLETPLLARARTLGLRTVDGLGMLMHQAVPAFEAFYGIRPKITPALRLELEKVLRGET